MRFDQSPLGLAQIVSRHQHLLSETLNQPNPNIATFMGSEPNPRQALATPLSQRLVDTRIKKLNRHLRELLTPCNDAILLAEADAFRDARNWENAYGLYQQFLQLQPERNGLLIQAGHCLK